jgi:hypothetical protein
MWLAHARARIRSKKPSYAKYLILIKHATDPHLSEIAGKPRQYWVSDDANVSTAFSRFNGLQAAAKDVWSDASFSKPG